MADVWTAEREDALRAAWRAEIGRAARRRPSVEMAVCLEAVVLSRMILLGLDAVGRFDDGEPDAAMGEVIRSIATPHLVGMAHRLRALGLNHDDVRKLDFGRRRRRHADA